MGSSHSVQEARDEDESQDGEDDDEEEGEDEEEDENAVLSRNEMSNTHLVKKVLEQEPEMLPCYASASPLSPQLSALGTPRMGPSIKVWDPYNVLAPPPPLPPPPPVFSRSFSSSTMEEDRGATEVFLISHGECEASLRPDLVGGRCAAVGLTANGKRQARALAVLLNSHGVRFCAVYSSPLDRARSMASLVCQEMNFSSERIQLSDALTEMSQGQWEGCSVSEVYTPEILGVMERLQPDFSAPGGESLREVEFRTIRFLNGTVLGLPEKLHLDFSLHGANENHRYSHQNAYASSNFIGDRDGPYLPSPRSDVLHHRHRQGFAKKKSGKSRLQYVTTTGDHDPEDENSPQEVHPQNTLHDLSERSSLSSMSSCVGIFTHPTTIKCLITGIMGCSPLMSHKICVEDSSVTVLQHSWKMGWQIKRLNDTSHLRLL